MKKLRRGRKRLLTTIHWGKKGTIERKDKFLCMRVGKKQGVGRRPLYYRGRENATGRFVLDEKAITNNFCKRIDRQKRKEGGFNYYVGERVKTLPGTFWKVPLLLSAR